MATVPMIEAQKITLFTRSRLSHMVQIWSKRTQNHRETPRDDPNTCSYCLGNATVCPLLCEQCQGFSSLDHVLFCKLGRLRDHDVGTLSAMLARKACSICNIISNAILEKLSIIQNKAELENSNVVCSLSGPFWPCGRLGTWASLFEESSQFHEYKAFYRVTISSAINDKLIVKTDIQVLLAYPKHSEDSFFCSTWISSAGDLLSMTLAWLDRCKRKHQSLCGTREKAITPELPPEFRLIDLEDRCIVSPPADCQYLALSYVWGAPGVTEAWLDIDNISTLRTKGGIDTLQLPRTIKEAMELTSQLKFRYLWVDALCIIQRPAGSDQQQLRAMGAIYHLSQMTIVVASGSDANAGLPGFQAHPRLPAAHNNTRELFGDWDWYKPNFETTIPLTAWSTRGWTMQEQLLSQRCLFITQHQIYFQCRRSTLEEDYGHFERGHQGDTRLYSNLLYHPNIKNKMEVVVTQFTRRNLTHPSDILDAFAGITNVLNSQTGVALLDPNLIISNEAAPIHFTGRRNLADALSWDWEENPVKRPNVDYPSWHWSAWLGPIDFPMNGRGTLIYDSPYLYFPNQGWKRIDLWYETDKGLNNLHSKKFQYQARQVPWSLLIRCEYLAQDSFCLDLTGDDEPGTLVALRDNYPLASKQSVRMKISLKNSENGLDGIIDVKETWRSIVESSQVRLGLIALKIYQWPSGKEVKPAYLRADHHAVLTILLVRQDDNGYCSRLGLGELSEDGWKSAWPKNQSIVLI